MVVLDCFTHTGAFALNCAAAGAEKVTAVDISALAIEQVKKNTALNGLEDRMEYLCADDEVSAEGRISRDVLLLPLHAERSLCEDAA